MRCVNLKLAAAQLFPAVAGLSLSLAVARVEAAEVTATLENPPSSGIVALALFDSPNTFGDLRDPFRVATFDVDGQESYVLSDIPPGDYALMVYYDENDNREIDRNFIGIPIEPLGFSNDYRPKGPPGYSRAAFNLARDERREFSIELYRPLGKRGRLGVGVGAISRSSPYRGYDGRVTQVIPAISYNGARLQLLGPSASFSLVGTKALRLAAVGTYRLGVYDENDSDYLEGMGDRDSTFMAGLAVQAELPLGFDLSLSYQHDALDRIGGGEARVAIDKSFQFGPVRVSPELGVNWVSQDLANYDFGVPENRSTADRPAYRLDSVVTFDVGAGLLYEITTDWLIVMNVAVEVLDDEITDSPIVDEDYVVKGFLAVNYLF